MTEVEWLERTDPKPMLEFLRGKTSDRKLRLFACACCRRIWHLLVHPFSRNAVEVAERFADGQATDNELYRSEGEADDIRNLLGDVGTDCLEPDAEEEYGALLEAAGISPDEAAPAAEEAWRCTIQQMTKAPIGASAAEAVQNGAGTDGSPDSAAGSTERAAQANLLREIIGNPFRPVWIQRASIPANILKRAQTIYDKRTFERLPKLADSLHKTGWYEPAVLSHLRGPGPHVRGCWALDALLGKSEPLTEIEWLVSVDPGPMLEFMKGKASERKLRLFAVACCRRIWHLLNDERNRQAVEMAERFADGHADLVELMRAMIAADETLADWSACAAPRSATQESAWSAACSTTGDAASAAAQAAGRDPPGLGNWDAACDAAYVAEQHAQCNLLRDVLGNPIRPVAAASSWLKPSVVKLAQTIYDKRAFDRLPKLADALEKAGCDNADMLAHCRQPGEHVRGCWVVDLMLGKE